MPEHKVFIRPYCLRRPRKELFQDKMLLHEHLSNKNFLRALEKKIKHSSYTKYNFIDISMFNKLYT